MRLRTLMPGLLVAATGVGAGDLITAALAGSAVGLGLLWAAPFGAVLKWFLNEGLARWQVATGTTLLEGWARHFGSWLSWTFLVYLVIWSFVVGGALSSACGVAGAAIVPLGSPETGKVLWGLAHALVGWWLVRRGGFRAFETGMALAIALMFATVVAAAVLSRPPVGELVAGLLRPSLPEEGLGWCLGVLGGVGGTVTLLSYGYWIREHRRAGREGLVACRIDLGVAYALTAVFGVSMIVIGSRVEVSGSGAGVALALAAQLESTLGPLGRGLFLAGFWGAVFSSLLGVWQGVPYLFADLMALRRGERDLARDVTSTRDYRLFQAALVLVPLVLLAQPVPAVQLAYAVLGALFMPLLAVTLLVLGNRSDRIGASFRNGIATNAGLVLTLVFFLALGARAILRVLG